MNKIVLAVISGLGVALSFNFPRFSFLLWFSLIPLFYLLDKKVSLRGAFYFLIFSLVYCGLTFYWVAYVSFLGFVLLTVYLSLFYLLFYLLGSFFIKRPLRQLTIPAAWVIVEFLKEIIWCGFGWANLGYSQFNNLYLIQIAGIGGVKLISFLIVFVNFIIWEILVLSAPGGKRAPAGIFFKRLILLCFLFAVIGGYSYYRLHKSRPEADMGITLVRTNFEKRGRRPREEKEEIVAQLSLLAGKSSKDDLVVFPEAAWPYLAGGRGIDKLKRFAAGSRRNIVIGAIDKKNGNYYNSAFFLDKEGKLVNSYNKVRLVPFGEYVPLRRYLSFIPVLNSIGDITPGREQVTFSYRGRKFSLLICFEDIFPLYVARAAAGKDFLLNITDDSWFLGEPEASQHLSMMVLRAVENRIAFARVANAGISACVSPLGRIRKMSAGLENSGQDSVRSFKIRADKERSFYNRCRGWFVFVCLIILAASARRRSTYPLL